MIFKTTYKESERGEGVFSLVIGAVLFLLIIVGVMKAGSMVRDYIRENSTIATITVVKGKVDEIFGLESGFGNNTDLVPTLNVLNAWPSGVLAGSTPTHEWDGTIQVIGGPGGNAALYRIQLNSMPDDPCITIAQKFAVGSSNANTLEALTINGTAQTAPYSVANISSACQNSDNNTLAMDFR